MLNKKGIPLLEELTVDRLISAFYYELPQDFDYEGEAHPGWEFVYVDRGSVKVRAGSDTYILKSGEMVCHQPMEYHCLNPYGGQAAVIVVCFHWTGSRQDWFRNKILTINPRQKQYLNDIVTASRGLLEPKTPLQIARDGQMERSQWGTVAQEQTVKNTVELLALSLLEADCTERSERVERYEQHLHRKNLTAQITEYLLEHMQEPVRLEDLADRFSYSLSSVRRIFREETGQSVMSWLTAQRMECAKKLLTQKGLTVEAVSLAVGYSNIYYFSNAFKKQTGKSPSQYRKGFVILSQKNRSEQGILRLQEENKEA